ncbi:toprim domain-containing protein [Haloglycomyces albus]|uniref:toprim domain-containing protein n=1 Tax=Haloglycomyces albus TaxID=526067 RepID=UPI001FE09C74|nr:toprim domain-containing protein [Haloglycomyces albus]
MPTPDTTTSLETRTTRHHAALWDSDTAAAYLSEARGITAETAITHRLGVVSEADPAERPVSGYLALPYITPSESVVSIRYRCIRPSCTQDNQGEWRDTEHHEGHPKYWSLPGDRQRPYNTAALLSNTDTLVVCEGEMDTLTALQCGLTAVGLPGAQAWQRPLRLAMQGIRRVVILADDDAAGHQFAGAVAADVDGAEVVPVTGGDVTSVCTANSRERIRELVYGTH